MHKILTSVRNARAQKEKGKEGEEGSLVAQKNASTSTKGTHLWPISQEFFSTRATHSDRLGSALNDPTKLNDPLLPAI